MRLPLLPVFGAAVLMAAMGSSRAEAPALACVAPQQVRQVAELLFGRNIGGRLGVSEAAWGRFVTRELTPRFPDGLTVTNAIGQWRDPTAGRIVHEPSKRVEIVLPGNGDDQARLEAVAHAYKEEFRQRSVGIIVRPACVSF